MFLLPRPPAVLLPRTATHFYMILHLRRVGCKDQLLRQTAVGIIVCLLLTTGTTVVAGADTTEVRIEPGTATVADAETVQFDVTLASASNGVGSFDIELELDEPAVATVTNVSVAESATFLNVDVEGNGSSVSIDAVGTNTSDTGPVTLATVTVRTTETGTTDLSMAVIAVGDEAGNEYDVSNVRSGTLSVTAEETENGGGSGGGSGAREGGTPDTPGQATAPSAERSPATLDPGGESISGTTSEVGEVPTSGSSPEKSVDSNDVEATSPLVESGEVDLFTTVAIASIVATLAAIFIIRRRRGPS